MKNLFQNIFIFSILTYACSSKSDPGISLVGTWKVVNTSASGCTSSSNNNNTSCTSNCITVVFTSTTYSSCGGSGTYSINGNKITLTSGGTTVIETFTLSGNTLTISTAKDSSTGCVYTSVLAKS